MNRVLGMILLIVGVILVSYGIRAAESLGSEFSEFFTGAPTNEALWLLLAGIVCAVLGLFATLRITR